MVYTPNAWEGSSQIPEAGKTISKDEAAKLTLLEAGLVDASAIPATYVNVEGDTMTSTLVIDPATDVTALKIVPPNNTATTKKAILVRNTTDAADVFMVDNAGNIVTVGTVDGVDVSGIPSTYVKVAGDTITSTLVIDPATAVTALKIVPQNTDLDKYMIQGRNVGDGADAFRLDNSGNIWTMGVLKGYGLNMPHVVKKAASANVRNSHDAEATTQATVYTKLKTITLTNGLLGIQRFLFDIKTSDGANTATSRIYRNGVALGTEQTDVTGTYATKSEDLTQDWNPGDTCELWAKIDNATKICSVRNFRLAYDDSPTVAVVSANT